LLIAIEPFLAVLTGLRAAPIYNITKPPIVLQSLRQLYDVIQGFTISFRVRNVKIAELLRHCPKGFAPMDSITHGPARWNGVKRDFTAKEVRRLAGSVRVAHTLADRGARRLWQMLHDEPYVAALGALTGNQALQQVKAGLKSIYLSGWQVAADANNAGQMYPDQSLYPSSSVPDVVRRINRTFQRADQIQTLEGDGAVDFFAPIVADAEAGFGGPLNAFELMRR
jgi:isocitrate lyase